MGNPSPTRGPTEGEAPRLSRVLSLTSLDEEADDSLRSTTVAVPDSVCEPDDDDHAQVALPATAEAQTVGEGGVGSSRQPFGRAQTLAAYSPSPLKTSIRSEAAPWFNPSSVASRIGSLKQHFFLTRNSDGFPQPTLQKTTKLERRQESNSVSKSKDKVEHRTSVSVSSASTTTTASALPGSCFPSDFLPPGIRPSPPQPQAFLQGCGPQPCLPPAPGQHPLPPPPLEYFQTGNYGYRQQGPMEGVAPCHPVAAPPAYPIAAVPSGELNGRVAGVGEWQQKYAQPPSAAVGHAAITRQDYMRDVNLAAASAYYRGLTQQLATAQRQQPIIINNSAMVESQTEVAQTAPEGGKLRSGLLDRIVDGVLDFWSSRLNRLMVFSITGAALYVFWEWWQHRKRMDLLQRRIDANPVLRVSQYLSGAIDNNRRRSNPYYL